MFDFVHVDSTFQWLGAAMWSTVSNVSSMKRGGRAQQSVHRPRLPSKDLSVLCFKPFSVARMVEAGEWIDLLKAYSLWHVLDPLTWRGSLVSLSNHSFLEESPHKILYN